MSTLKTALLLLSLLALVACTSPEELAPDGDPLPMVFEVVAEMTEGPGNITVTPSGQMIVSLHQLFGHEIRVATVNDDGTTEAFAMAAELDSVLGLQSDADGVVWLLDNAMRNQTTRRLVGWHAAEDRPAAEIDLTSASIDGSFLNDLAVDPIHRAVYIADPAGGADAAIVVVDLATGTARRVLEGHPSVTPEDVDLVIDGAPLRIRREDGTEIAPRIGINPIAIDRDAEWLYYGPMHGLSMYRIRTADLRDTELSAEDLASRVERWADKPICDGISIDDDGNLYLGDLASNAIGVIGPDREYRVLVVDDRLSWVDAFSFGPDGKLYSVANQLHRAAALNGGVSAVEPPFLVISIDPLAAGTVGR
jgi:sugar lactone lactonase YvrE